MAYADLAAELTGTIPGLSPLLAATYIRQAWREIRNERAGWSFKTGQAALVCPAVVSAGTVLLVQGSPTIVFNVAASTALGGFVAGIPLLTQMQVRFAGGPLYQILNVTNLFPLTCTLDRPVSEVTNAASIYQCYRAYVTPPVSDFTRFDALDDYTNGIRLVGDRLTRTSVWFDLRDPQRTAMGTAAWLGSVVSGTGGLPLYELWPHPTAGQTFLVTYRRTGAEFLAPTDTQPAVIPDSLIMTRALGWHAYPWAQANRGRFPALAKTDFSGLVVSARQQYAIDLKTILLQDDDLALETVYNRGHFGGGRSGPIAGALGDAAFWQSHPIYW